MDLRKIVGLLLVVFVLFWIISSPNNAGGTVNNIMGDLRDAGDSLITFIHRVV